MANQAGHKVLVFSSFMKLIKLYTEKYEDNNWDFVTFSDECDAALIAKGTIGEKMIFDDIINFKEESLDMNIGDLEFVLG